VQNELGVSEQPLCDGRCFMGRPTGASPRDVREPAPRGCGADYDRQFPQPGAAAARPKSRGPRFSYFVIWIRRSMPSFVCSRPS
jgi:hypothetical protein